MIMNRNVTRDTLCKTDTATDTELAHLVEKVEKHSPRIMEIRDRVELVLARLTGPQPEAEQPEESKPGGLIQRLDYAYDRAVGSINDLEESVARLEALV
jgi:hypothetical protein